MSPIGRPIKIVDGGKHVPALFGDLKQPSLVALHSTRFGVPCGLGDSGSLCGLGTAFVVRIKDGIPRVVRGARDTGVFSRKSRKPATATA